LTTVAAPALTQEDPKAGSLSTVAELKQRYPAGSINSEEQASRAQKDVKTERAAIEARMKKEQRECVKEFLVTECRERAKERRRNERAQLKQIETEAARYQRQQRVVKRDDALAEKREREEADAGKRAKEKVKTEKKQAQRAARGGAGPGVSGKPPLTAEERAENVRAYDKKIADYEKNKKKVDERKAKNDLKRANKRAAVAREKEKEAKAAAQRAMRQE
jgi:hypothetical protein